MKVQIRLNSRSDAGGIVNINIFMDDENASRLATAMAASSVATTVFWNVDRSARFNFSDLLWATVPSCLPFVEFQYSDAEAWDVTDPENGAMFEQLWMNVFCCYGNPDYWIRYQLDDGMGVGRFLRCITDGRWKLQIGFEQSATDLVVGVDRQVAQQRLCERMQQILYSLPPAEVSRIARSLPRLQTHRRIVQLSDGQVRHCLHAISRTIRLERVMARLRMALPDLDDPCQSDALWKQMACELNFAISTANWFNRQLHNPFNNIMQTRAKLYRDRHEVLDRFRRFSIYEHNLNLHLGADLERDEFLERSALERPEALRLIDIEATCGSEVEGGVVHLVEYEDGMMGFSAISHTFGMDVYKMFDCQCCTVSSTGVPRKARPRVGPCPHHERVSSELKQERDRVVGDIVRMCGWLKEAGVRYAWHDGVCIAQHDEEEVKASIQRMGWVYAYAEETIVFLHYVGTPVAILRNVDLMVEWDLYGLTPRWQMRAWTFQETVLSAKRRYCIRVGSREEFGQCNSLEEFERMVEGWYDDDTSSIKVVEESTFMEIVWDTYSALQACVHICWSDLAAEYHRHGMDDPGRVLLYPKICAYLKTFMWADGLWGFRCTLSSASSRSRFRSTATTLEAISNRDSKHVGDRINCILAVGGVKGFITPKDFKDPKDGNMDHWTVKFFSMQDQKRLEAALYAVNYRNASNQQRSWAPSLERHLTSPSIFQGGFHASKQYLEYKVLPDGKLQVVGDIVCVKVNFRVNNAARVKFSVSTLGGGDHDWAGPAACAADLNPLRISSSDVSATAQELRARIDEMSHCYFGIIGGGDQTSHPPPPPFSPDSAVSGLRQYVLSLGPDSQQSPASNSATDLWRAYVDIVCAEAMHTMFMDNFGTAEPVHGWSVLEAIGRDQEAEAGVSMELRPGMEERFEAMWEGDAGCRFGTLVCPYISEEGRDAFSAYLLVPLLCHREMGKWPTLMVEGDLTESGCAVDKIGVMEPTRLFRACFHHFVNTQPGNAIHLTNLLIN